MMIAASSALDSLPTAGPRAPVASLAAPLMAPTASAPNPTIAAAGNAVTGNTAADGPSAADVALRSRFQEAAAGLFFGQLMKALRSTTGKTAYLHGGQAEEMFQAQLDQQFATQLATERGGVFVEELYQQFRRQLNLPEEGARRSADSADDRSLNPLGQNGLTGPERLKSTGLAEPSGAASRSADADTQTPQVSSAPPVPSASSDFSAQLSDLTQAVRQASPVATGARAAIDTTGLTSLFRK
jgi:Rod binding domain-containing protein